MAQRINASTKGTRRGRIPLNMPLLLIAVIGLIISGAVTVFGSAYTVNRLNEKIIDEAREEARVGATAACEGIKSFVAAHPNLDLEQLVRHPSIKGKLGDIINSDTIVLAEIRDAQGRVLVRESCPNRSPAKTEIMWREQQGPSPAMLLDSGTKVRTAIIPVSFPLERDGVFIGQIELGLSREAALNRIEFLAAQVSTSITQMVIVIMALLLLSLVVIYISFARQIALFQHATDREQMANLGALAAGLAHEIRNPLHAMSLHLDYAREELTDGPKNDNPQEVIAAIDRVKGQVERLNGIVTNFLSLSLPNQIAFEPVMVDRVVSEVSMLLKPELDRAGIALSVDIPEESVIADPRALQQVLLNVVLNAAQILGKHSGEKRIHIGWGRAGRLAEIYVDDSGPGVPSEDAEAIFAGFVSKRSGGTGFGLSIARRIMEAHRGSIHVERSETLGGARFVLQFPTDPVA